MNEDKQGFASSASYHAVSLKIFFRMMVLIILTLHAAGCASAPIGAKQVATPNVAVSVKGFVKFPGKYAYRERMTVADALAEQVDTGNAIIVKITSAKTGLIRLMNCLRKFSEKEHHSGSRVKESNG